MSEVVLKKVTALITRDAGSRRELLLFEHPTAGIQIPAGTVEMDETPQAAVLREAREETGLHALSIRQALGQRAEDPPPHRRVVWQPTTVYSRPDAESFDWSRFPRGVEVQVLRRAEGFTHVRFVEWDDYPAPQFVTYAITGWVPDDTLTSQRHRYLYWLTCQEETPDRWELLTDHHRFAPFWAPLDDLPLIIAPQRPWLAFLPNKPT